MDENTRAALSQSLDQARAEGQAAALAVLRQENAHRDRVDAAEGLTKAQAAILKRPSFAAASDQDMGDIMSAIADLNTASGSLKSQAGAGVGADPQDPLPERDQTTDEINDEASDELASLDIQEL